MSQNLLKQVPFDKSDLMGLRQFLRFCKQNGLPIEEEDLEFYEKIGVFYPTVRINVGTATFRNIIPKKPVQGDPRVTDKHHWKGELVEEAELPKLKGKYKKLLPEKWYAPGHIITSAPDWFEFHDKQGVVKYPAQEKFKPWKTYRVPVGFSFSQDYKDFEHVTETMYSRMQLYPLREIHRMFTMKVSPQSLYKGVEHWKKVGERVASDRHREVLELAARRKVDDWYRRIGFQVEVEQMWRDRREELNRFAEELIEDTGLDEEGLKKDEKALRQIRKELVDHAKIYDRKKELRERAVKMLSEHTRKYKDRQPYHVDDPGLKEWLNDYLNNGTFGKDRGTFIAGSYFITTNDEDLANAEDAYKRAYMLNWFIKVLYQEKIDLRDRVRKARHNLCRYCRETVKDFRTGQETCGSKECTRKHRNAQKRRRRAAEKGLPPPV